jgi:hypothetical protein
MVEVSIKGETSILDTIETHFIEEPKMMEN